MAVYSVETMAAMSAVERVGSLVVRSAVLSVLKKVGLSATK